MDLVAELEAIVRVLDAAQVRYAICGGVAVTVHGAPRSTDDLDILVAPEMIERATEAVRAVGYTFAALPLVFDQGSERERHVQRITKVHGDEHLILDILHASGPFSSLLERTIVVELDGGPTTFVNLDALLEMKQLAQRPKDLADIEALGEVSGRQDPE